MLAKHDDVSARSAVCWPNMTGSQQEFLSEVALALGHSPVTLAERMGASWATFERWLLPPSDEHAREMPASAWQLAREILSHAKLNSQTDPLADQPASAPPSLEGMRRK